MNALELQMATRTPVSMPSITYTNMEELLEEIKDAHEGGCDQMVVYGMPGGMAYELSKYWFYHLTAMEGKGACIVKWRGYERWLVSGGADSRVCAELGALSLLSVAEKHPHAVKIELVKF